MVFRIKATVATLLCTLAMGLVSTKATAEDSGSSKHPCQGFYDQESLGTDYSKTADFETKKINCEKKHPASGAGNSCDLAGKTYKEAKTKFGSSCGAAGLKNDGPSGNFACSYSIAKCDCENLGPGDSRRKKLQCSDAKPVSSHAQTTSDGSPLYDTAAEAQKYDNCPPLAGTDLDKLDAQIKDSKTTTAAADKVIPDLEKDVTEAKADKDANIEEIRDQASSAEEDYKKKLADLRNGARTEQGRIKAAVAALEQQMIATQQQIRDLNTSKIDIENGFRDALREIEVNCHNDASTKVSQLQTVEMQKLAAGQWNGGSFDQMLNRVGVSSRGRWNRLARKYYAWCLADKKTVDSRLSKAAAKDAQITRVNGSITSANQKIASIQQQILSITTSTGCNTASANSSETCQAQTEFQQQFAEARSTFEDEMDSFEEKERKAIKAGNLEISRTKKALAKAKQNYTDEQMRLHNLRSLLALKQSKGGTMAASAQSVSDAFANYSALLDSASEAVTCGNKSEKCDTDCENARNLLTVLGLEPDPMPQSVQPQYEERRVASEAAPVAPTTQPVAAPAPTSPATATPASPTPNAGRR